MGLKGEKKKVDYELTLGDLEGQKRRATSVRGRSGEHRHGVQGGATGMSVQRRAGVEKTQPRLRVWICPKSNFKSYLNAPPILLYFRKKKVEKADMVGS